MYWHPIDSCLCGIKTKKKREGKNWQEYKFSGAKLDQEMGLGPSNEKGGQEL